MRSVSIRSVRTQRFVPFLSRGVSRENMTGFALLSCCAVALVILCQSSEAYVALSPAVIKNGKCIFEDFTIGDNETVHDDRHCHTMTCSVEKKLVTLEGCPSFVPHSHCWLDEGPHSGSYPDCCPKIKCDPGETVEHAA